MGRKCLVHIGWHKTGTTTIQDFCLAQRSVLASQNVHYPKLHRNHSPFLFMSVASTDGMYHAEHFVPPLPGTRDFDRRKSARTYVAQQLKFVADKHLLLSAEDLCLLKRKEIESFRDMLAAEFDHVQIICFVRQHESYALSVMQQLVRMGYLYQDIITAAQGGTKEVAGVRTMSPIPHYAQRLEDWMTLFGEENVELRKFEDDARREHGVLSAFADYAKQYFGLETLEMPTAKFRSNQALSAKGVSLLNHINGLNPLLCDTQVSHRFVFNAQGRFAQLSGASLGLSEQLSTFSRDAMMSDQGFLNQFFTKEQAYLPHPPKAGDGTLPKLSDEERALAEIAFGERKQGANAKAREKLFSALLSYETSGRTEKVDDRLYASLFSMTEPALLKSSANWLAKYGLKEEEDRFLEKSVSLN